MSEVYSYGIRRERDSLHPQRSRKFCGLNPRRTGGGLSAQLRSHPLYAAAECTNTRTKEKLSPFCSWLSQQLSSECQYLVLKPEHGNSGRLQKQGPLGKVRGLPSGPPSRRQSHGFQTPARGHPRVWQRIAQNFGLQRLSSGHFLRENLNASTEVGHDAKRCLEKGLLGPDHVITPLMMSELETRSAQHWLLDGFPRTLVQGEALDRICDVDLVISLKIPFETLEDHPSQRWIHPSSGRVYNLDFSPPQVLGIDDITGEALVQQEDDRPEAIAARPQRYKDAAELVIELYKSRGVLHQFSGSETNRIWPHVYSLFSNKIAPIQSKEAHRACHWKSQGGVIGHSAVRGLLVPWPNEELAEIACSVFSSLCDEVMRKI
ncbi:adenylate kinase 4, mitochondrial-like [Psammomys obesus]|uniref:adenylate kinase 4, mitochondrial-like n=1 Tax=Psammomys obesus TaxID=48139 RepID=UPI002452F6B1|nr:adenylate kinase 4, mitochondrial-like [Psammomys obesus]